MWANQIHLSHWLKTVSQPCSERIGKLHAVIQLQDSESSSKRTVYSLSCACNITFRVFISQSMPPSAALFSCSRREARLIHSNYGHWNWIEAGLFTRGCGCLAFWEWNQSSSQTAQGLPKATPTNLHLCFCLVISISAARDVNAGGGTSIMFFFHRNKVCRQKK